MNYLLISASVLICLGLTLLINSFNQEPITKEIVPYEPKIDLYVNIDDINKSHPKILTRENITYG